MSQFQTLKLLLTGAPTILSQTVQITISNKTIDKKHFKGLVFCACSVFLMQMHHEVLLEASHQHSKFISLSPAMGNSSILHGIVGKQCLTTLLSEQCYYAYLHFLKFVPLCSTDYKLEKMKYTLVWYILVCCCNTECLSVCAVSRSMSQAFHKVFSRGHGLSGPFWII